MGKKFYVVWKGRKTGVFESWDECNLQIQGVGGALYKSFKTKELAEEAFTKSSKEYIGNGPKKAKAELSELQKYEIGMPILESIAVDGAWNTTTGVVEYQGVYVKTGEQLFMVGPFNDGTNNIVEFLGIVHALAYCKQKNLSCPIYSDSKTAIVWVNEKIARTNHKKNEQNRKLFELIERAIKWLNENDYSNQILKWESKAWGENPADFGRK
jgi:ribonuclease HI